MYGSVLLCVVSVLQCVVDSQCAAVCCSVVKCTVVCCSTWQCAAVCCSVLQCAGVATMSRLLNSTKEALFCKETYNFKEPTNRSNSIAVLLVNTTQSTHVPEI